MFIEVGTKVLIARDCRDGGEATGQIGVYEGEFPLSVLVVEGEKISEYAYTDFVEWNEQAGDYAYQTYDEVDFLDDPRPSRPPADAETDVKKEIFRAWEEWDDRNKLRMRYYLVSTNPRIRLEDGSVIWGAECWWGKAEDAPPTLEEAQAQVDNLVSGIKVFMKVQENENG